MLKNWTCGANTTKLEIDIVKSSQMITLCLTRNSSHKTILRKDNDLANREFEIELRGNNKSKGAAQLHSSISR